MPVDHTEHRAFPSEKSSGLYVYEYFAAHAPETVPEWFTPILSKKPEQVELPYTTFKFHENPEWQSAFKKWWDEYDCVFIDEYEGKKVTYPEGLREAVEKSQLAYEENNAAREEWEKQKQIETYFQWRQFYANKMCELYNR